MQVGTIDPVDEEIEEPRKPPFRSFSGGGSSGGSNDGGDDGRDPGHDMTDGSLMPNDKTRILTGFVLLVVLMTFGGLIGAYVVIATNQALEWKPFALPIQAWISTFLIIASSVTYVFAHDAIQKNDIDKARKFLIATTVLGGVFIASQLLAWLALVERGLYMRGNPYAGFFYILTAAHAVHVIGGIVALGAVLLRNWYPTGNDQEREYRRNVARSVGWYWHFMGGLWIVLFLLLAFWN